MHVVVTILNIYLYYIGLGIGIAVLMVTAIVLCGTVILLFHKQCSNKDPR